MKIRFKENTTLNFISGWDFDLGKLKTDSKEFVAGSELETFTEDNSPFIRFVCQHGIADEVPPHSFQILSLANN